MKHATTKNVKRDLVSVLASDIAKTEGKMTNNQIFQYFLVEELKKRIRKEGEIGDNIIIHSQSNDKETALAKAEEKIGMALQNVGDAGVEEESEEGDGKAKYKNIDSILKYVENPNDKGQAVKLVIMNFND